MAVSIGARHLPRSVRPGPGSEETLRRLRERSGVGFDRRCSVAHYSVRAFPLALFKGSQADGGHAFDCWQVTQPGDQGLRAGRADRGVAAAGLAAAATGNAAERGLLDDAPLRGDLGGAGCAVMALLHPVDGAHGDPGSKVDSGDLRTQRGDFHAGRGNAARGALYPAGPAAALQVQPPVVEHRPRVVPVEQPDPRQRVLVPGQRLHDLVGPRGDHLVVLRQRLDPAGGVALRQGLAALGGGSSVRAWTRCSVSGPVWAPP